jgi:WD40 repeat protein
MRAAVTLVMLLLGAAGAAAQAVDQDGLYREPFLVVDPGMHTASIWRLDGDAAGRFLVTGSLDKTVRVWSAEDGRLQRTIRVPAGPGNVGQIYAVALSPDGGTVAAGGWTGSGPGKQNIYLFERSTGREIGRIGELPRTVVRLAFSPDGSKLAAAIREANGVRLFDAGSLQEVAEDKDYGSDSNGLAFAPDGRIATTSFDGKIRLYGPMLDKPQTVLAPDGQLPFAIAFSPDGSRIAVGYVDTIRVTVLDERTLQKLVAPDPTGIVGNVASVAWSADGKLLYGGGSWNRNGTHLLRTWAEGGGGIALDYRLTRNTIEDLRSLVGQRLVVVATDPRVVMMDQSGSVIWQAEPRTADFRTLPHQLLMSADGTRARFNFDVEGKSPTRFDLHQRRLDAAPSTDSGFSAGQIAGLDIKSWENTEQPTLAGQRLELEQYETSRSLAISPSSRSFVLGTEWYLRRFDDTGKLLWKVSAPGTAWAVNITADGRIVVAAYSDGTIRWHRMSDGAALLAFFPHSDGKRWVAWTPLGHYIASPGGEDLIQWQINRGLDHEPEVYTASRFRDQFYRPDVIDRVLEELDPQKALDAADLAAGRRATAVKSIAEDTPPRVAIIDPADATFVEKLDLSVAYIIEDRPGTAIRRVRLLLDGRVVADAKDLTIPAGGKLNGELKVTLQGDASVLTLLADSEKGSSDPATIRIRRNASNEDYKPTLYVLAVGVSHFKNAPYLDLGYADADAKDFVRHLKQQEHGLYKHVVDDTLVNEEATGAAILDGFEWLERHMSSRDVAAVFVSTHGANDANKDFFLLPYDVELRDEIRLRRTAVRYTDQ